MSRKKSRITVGKFGSTFGFLGWIKIFSYTDHAKNILNYQPWLIKQKSEWKQFQLEQWRYSYKNIIVKIKEVDTKQHALTLTNCIIYIHSLSLPKLLARDEFYYHELFGMKVVTVQGYSLGIVVDILETGSNDVLVLQAPVGDAFGKKERLIPFLNGEVIRQISPNIQEIKVNWDPNF
ncbi:ribosome maturation factor [Candidatus Photodesmus katoptron]|uniref:Ribosome maturation factor RimM n=1 Tax=Candidatus Photodesmus katoptron Akat1 TaxID=1236703 RepID=S3DL40_9GAMM|nr:ribosome maturation factor RimM [Candidatus Photodesmus katoptron]EPE37849.1 16S rRNA processing protein RimM [Candidatus Photodesmus katoptron Akat1]KEY90432.1 ribosome maturation factor [Candidatus Photodesmus katoptron]